ncbi:MAG: S8 family serine peptidase [Planctomycetes bacterium]|nr:S8 family serine peptidase [Planctomycetota bacterium]
MSKGLRASIIAIAALAFIQSDCMLTKLYALAESTTTNGSNAKALHDIGITGQGVNIALIASDNARTTHEAFDVSGTPHAFAYDFTGDGINITSHDTWMAGIATSRGGTLYPDDIGIAPGADLHSARIVSSLSLIQFDYIADALEELVINQNCKVLMTGIALTPPADGQSDWTLICDYYADKYDTIFAFPVGNTPSQIYVFSDAYNAIAVAGLKLTDPANQYIYNTVGTASGAGPTLDGRRKPDIAAPSQYQTFPSAASDTAWYTWTFADGATSFSVPHAAGVAALLIEHANSTPNPNDIHSEVIRAAIINSTFPNIDDRAENKTAPADSNNTWHPQRGYGRIDALRAYQTINQNQIKPSTTTSQLKGWAYENLPDLQLHSYYIDLEKSDRLITTITYNRKVEWIDEKTGTPPRTNGFIDEGELNPSLADIDLEIYAPNDTNAFYTPLLAGLDPDDNTQKYDILITTPGQYTIKVTNNSATGQDANYALAFEVIPSITGDFYPPDYIVDYRDLAKLFQRWLDISPDIEFDLIFDPADTINGSDFAEFANFWLNKNLMYY